jgi:hypothetical protein
MRKQTLVRQPTKFKGCLTRPASLRFGTRAKPFGNEFSAIAGQAPKGLVSSHEIKLAPILIHSIVSARMSVARQPAKGIGFTTEMATLGKSKREPTCTTFVCINDQLESFPVTSRNQSEAKTCAVPNDDHDPCYPN